MKRVSGFAPEAIVSATEIDLSALIFSPLFYQEKSGKEKILHHSFWKMIMDGLAPGVSFLIFIGYGYHALINANNAVLIISLAFIGALLGFLRYNSYPARIFLGDSGSLLLGFALTTIPFIQTNPTGHLNLTLPVILLAVPIFDTLRVAAYRVLHRRNPFLPDQSHIHHKLLRLGIRHDIAVLIIYGLTACFVIISFFINILSNEVLFAITAALVLLKIFLPMMLRALKSFTRLRDWYHHVVDQYSLIGLRQIIAVWANQSLLRHSILLFLFTQFAIMDYQEVPLYPLAFILLGMILYFYFNTGTWTDQFVMILVLFSVIFFQSIASPNQVLQSITWYPLVDMVNNIAIIVSVIVIAALMIKGGQTEAVRSIIHPIDYLVLLVLFLLFTMPVEQFGIAIEKYNLAKAAVVYLGIKSLFAFDVKGNRRIIFSVLILLLFTGAVGAFF